MNNRVLDAAPADLCINTHVCRGNFHSTWACEGGYDDVADALLANEHVNAFFLEFDDERSGSFAPLASVPAGKKVVLGLVTTKRAQLEDKQAVIARIHEAAKYVPLRKLRDRQQAHRGAAVGEGGARARDRRGSVGRLA